MYSYDTIVMLSKNPFDFSLWMNDEGFITTVGNPCPQCGKDTFLQESSHFKADGVCVRCVDRECAGYLSVRHGSFFEHRHLSIAEQMKLLILFMVDTPVHSAAKLLNRDRDTVADFFDSCRHVWQQELAREPVTFFNPWSEYECDEMCLKHVRGDNNLEIERQWIAGVAERDTGRCVLYRVAGRSHTDLLNPINQLVPHGALVYTDDFPTYRQLNVRFCHYSINHSKREYEREELLDDGTQIIVHTNTIEGIWNAVRGRMRYRARRNFARIDLVLAEFMYRRSGCPLYSAFKIRK